MASIRTLIILSAVSCLAGPGWSGFETLQSSPEVYAGSWRGEPAASIVAELAKGEQAKLPQTGQLLVLPPAAEPRLEIGRVVERGLGAVPVAALPSVLVGIGPPVWLDVTVNVRGIRLVRVGVRPWRYDPKSGQIVAVERVDYAVTFGGRAEGASSVGKRNRRLAARQADAAPARCAVAHSRAVPVA